MQKIAIVVVDLVPEEALEASGSKIEKEITKSLDCDWMQRIEKVTILDADANTKLRKKLQESGYKPEIIDKIIEYYNRK
ncbi:MAG: hypothetical protein ACQCN3_11250 [Candidatus Bathyarchaeia archaeon]|jgi:broad-specificity NMP kinase